MKQFFKRESELEVLGLIAFCVLPINAFGFTIFLIYGLQDISFMVIWVGLCTSIGTIIGLHYIIYCIHKKVEQ